MTPPHWKLGGFPERTVQLDGRDREASLGRASFYLSDPFGNPLCFFDEATVFLGHEKKGAKP
jgi:hypothetical protein